MSNSIDLSGWGGEIIEALGLSGVTTGSVVVWLQTNLGQLNLALRSDFSYIADSGIFDASGISMDEVAMNIYSKMYECAVYRKKSVQASQLGFSDWIEIAGDQQGSIRKVSKTELSKELRGIYKDCNDELNQAIMWYRRNGGPNPDGMPKQVTPLNVAPEPSPFVSISGAILPANSIL